MRLAATLKGLKWRKQSNLGRLMRPKVSKFTVGTRVYINGALVSFQMQVK
jgi:hypothetical protein